MSEHIDEILRMQIQPKIGEITKFTGNPSTTPFKESDLPRSQKLFDAVVALLSPKITGKCSFEHVGSSAMAGMPGKGSIDVMVLFEDATGEDTSEIVSNIKTLVDMGFRTALDLSWRTSPSAPAMDSVFVATITIPSATAGGQNETETVILHLVPPTSPFAVEFVLIKWLGEKSAIFRDKYANDKRGAYQKLSNGEGGEVDRTEFGKKKREVLAKSVRIIQAMMNIPPDSTIDTVSQFVTWRDQEGDSGDKIREFEKRLADSLSASAPTPPTLSHTVA